MKRLNPSAVFITALLVVCIGLLVASALGRG